MEKRARFAEEEIEGLESQIADYKSENLSLRGELHGMKLEHSKLI